MLRQKLDGILYQNAPEEDAILYKPAFIHHIKCYSSKQRAFYLTMQAIFQVFQLFI